MKCHVALPYLQPSRQCGVQEIRKHFLYDHMYIIVHFYYFHIHSKGNFILRAPSILDPLLQVAHLTPTAPREGQSPDLINRGQN